MRRKAQFAGFVCEGALALAVVALFHTDASMDNAAPRQAPSQDITRARTIEASKTIRTDETTIPIRVSRDETTPQPLDSDNPSCRDRLCRWLRRAIDW